MSNIKNSFNNYLKILRESRDKKKSLWKYNERSGLWDHQRNVETDTQDQWLQHFQKDEPNSHFHISANRPKHNPQKK